MFKEIKVGQLIRLLDYHTWGVIKTDNLKEVLNAIDSYGNGVIDFTSNEVFEVVDTNGAYHIFYSIKQKVFLLFCYPVNSLHKYFEPASNAQAQI